jgi:hypothetical protein
LEVSMRVQTLLGLAATTLLAACATPKEGGMGHGQSHMDANAMCEIHRQATAGNSPAEQQAAIEAHIKSMHGAEDPDMVTMHRRMMEKHSAPGTAPK